MKLSFNIERIPAPVPVGPLIRPANEKGIFTLIDRLPEEAWSLVKPYASYYDEETLEDFDMFYSDPGWRVSGEGIEKLLEKGFDCFLLGKYQFNTLSEIEGIVENHKRKAEEEEREKERQKAIQQEAERKEKERVQALRKQAINQLTDGLIETTVFKEHPYQDTQEFLGYIRSETPEMLKPDTLVFQKGEDRMVWEFYGNAVRAYLEKHLAGEWMKEAIEKSIKTPSSYLISTILHHRGIGKTTNFSDCYACEHYKIIRDDESLSEKAIQNYKEQKTRTWLTEEETQDGYLKDISWVNGENDLCDYLGIVDQVEKSRVKRRELAGPISLNHMISRFDSHLLPYLRGEKSYEPEWFYAQHFEDALKVLSEDREKYFQQYIEALKSAALSESLTEAEQQRAIDSDSESSSVYLEFSDYNLEKSRTDLEKLGLYYQARDAWRERYLKAYALNPHVSQGEVDKKHQLMYRSDKQGRFERIQKLFLKAAKAGKGVEAEEVRNLVSIDEEKLIEEDEHNSHGRSITAYTIRNKKGDSKKWYLLNYWWADFDDADDVGELYTSEQDAKEIYQRFK
jgi:hypothetical protein